MTTVTTHTARHRSADELRALAEEGARELGPDATADEVAAWAARTFPGTLAVACSMADAVLPAVVGHEGAGVVREVGHEVRGVAPGDKVVLSFPSCGECPRCRRRSRRARPDRR